MAIINNGNIRYTGVNGSSTHAGQKVVDYATYDFYYGDITVNVVANFGTASVYCLNHGYMGGINVLVYKSSCS